MVGSDRGYKYMFRVLLRVFLAQSLAGYVTTEEAHALPAEKNPTAKALPRHAAASAIAKATGIRLKATTKVAGAREGR